MANGIEGDATWNDEGGGGRHIEFPSSSSGDQMQTHLFDSRNENTHVNLSFRSTQEETSMSNSYFRSPPDTSRSSYEDDGGDSSKRLKLSQQGGCGESSEGESSCLGLKLSKTESFINLLEQELNEQRPRKRSSPNPNPSTSAKQQKMEEPISEKEEKLDNEKLKASNFPALYLRIGNWERKSIHEGDLVAKCYYKKGRLVWEVLDGSLKSKIEIQWSDIIGIKASKTDDECGILEIELNEKPLFFKETNPQPRKHTQWLQADDFTGGEALKYRRHYVKFAPGTLDKHYEKLLGYEQRISLLSQRPFPSKHSPYFTNAFGLPEFAIDFNAYQSHIHPMAQYPLTQSFPPSMASPHFQIVRQTTRPQIAYLDSNPTISVSNVVLDDQNIGYLNEVTNIANGNYVQVARPITSAVPNNMDFQNYPNNMGFPNQDFITISQGPGLVLTGPSNNNNNTLLGIQNHLLGDHMHGMNVERTMLARASPMCSSMAPLEVVVGGGGRTMNEQAMIQSNIGETSIPNDGLIWSNSNWLPQYGGTVGVQPSTYNSFYPNGLPNLGNF